MSDVELNEGQKRFIQAAGITTAEFRRLVDVHEKERAAFLAANPELNEQSDQRALNTEPTEKSPEPILREEVQPKMQEKTPEPYLPTKQATKEILEIAKEQGDEIGNDSIKLLDNVLYSGVAPYGNPISDVKNAATIAKDMADLGKIFFEKYAKHLGAFGLVATLLKDILNAGEPAKKDPVLQELGILRNELNVLSSKMEAQFGELRAFMVEQAFFAEYADNATTLMEYMVRTIQDVGKESLEDFEKHYNSIDPEFCVTRMLKVLERESSNPLKMSIKGAELPTKAVFNKWRDIIDGTLTQFLMLEDFASGLLHPDNKRKQNYIIEKITRFNTIVSDFAAELQVPKPNFEKIRNFVRRIQEDNSYPTDEDKVEIIFKTLDDLCRRDDYYVVVFHKDLVLGHKVTKQDQFLLSTDCGEFNVIVFCAYNHSADTINHFVEEFKKEPLFWSISISPFESFWHYMSQRIVYHLNEIAAKIDNYGVIMVISSNRVSTRWSKRVEGAKWGPGFFSYDYILQLYYLNIQRYNLFYLVSTT